MAELEELVNSFAEGEMNAQNAGSKVKALEKIIGVDLPDDIINKVIDGVKAKLAAGDIADKVDDTVIIGQDQPLGRNDLASATIAKDTDTFAQGRTVLVVEFAGRNFQTRLAQ